MEKFGEARQWQDQALEVCGDAANAALRGISRQDEHRLDRTSRDWRRSSCLPDYWTGVTPKVSLEKKEATCIARLLAENGTRIVGWVYLWNTSELSLFWKDRKVETGFIDPPIHPETLTNAKGTTPDDVMRFLDELPAVAPEGSISKP